LLLLLWPYEDRLLVLLGRSVVGGEGQGRPTREHNSCPQATTTKRSWPEHIIWEEELSRSFGWRQPTTTTQQQQQQEQQQQHNKNPTKCLNYCKLLFSLRIGHLTGRYFSSRHFYRHCMVNGKKDLAAVFGQDLRRIVHVDDKALTVVPK